ncbi:AAA family ATPase [Paenibacillus lemnae]|uniref:MoxR family ATPase n=1 Tax=Paenibacillus lemnae TaxID=1330551 RepID=A0A848MAG8_PAELE|nr:MoxR family ATPase [Paenibacillus lemnae]NMO98067.1 MoxR family ATPase [Paenibacillus lemnae]
MFHSSLQQEEPDHPYWGPELIQRAVQKVSSVIIGHEEQVRRAFMSMLAGGHILLEDVPGVGKTMLVRCIASVIGCDFGRIQFTSDLMPGDITGTTVYSPHTGDFDFRPGPVLANHMILADEINRASPRAQSALLELMEERKVTVDGRTYPLRSPFFLLATQNPCEFEGTNRLPEAQMDRFMMRLSLGYPDMEQEVLMLERAQDRELNSLPGPLLAASEITTMQRSVLRVYVDESIKKYLVQIADASRKHQDIRLGISPRGTLAWMRASQASAFMDGRMYVIPDDCLTVAGPVLAHRLQLGFEARSAGVDQHEALQRLIRSIELPRQRTRKGGRM